MYKWISSVYRDRGERLVSLTAIAFDPVRKGLEVANVDVF